jgi:AraC-like DNA-binding protein
MEIYPGIDMFSGIRRFFSDEDAAKTRKFRQIFDEPELHCSWFRFQAAVSDLCMELWRPEFSVHLKRYTKYESIFQEIAQYCDARLTVGQLAEKFEMTQEAFSRKFSKDVGHPPKELIQRTLLQKILLKLADPGLSMRTIADELKFSSEFYMQKFFKKQMGITIGEYRKRIDK